MMVGSGTPIGGQAITLFLCGDVMTGRGIDQILPNPVNPVLYEACVDDAREYVRLSETANGPILRPADFAYLWGDVLQELERAGTDARIINLETTITRAEDPWPKEINYRMSPGNIGCLTVADIDCCCLANNHILDWGYAGLTETIETLDKASISHAGAGDNLLRAADPAILELADKGRVLVSALGSPSSGIPCSWGAAEHRPGVNLSDLTENTASRVAGDLCTFKRPGDVAVVSIHWGENWGYEIPSIQIKFAHRLVDEGVDLVHGHSSHHVKAIEVYRDRLILYGCGDFLTDYEGITGYAEFRGDLALMYLVTFDPHQHQVLNLRLVPVRSRRFQLKRASPGEAQWLARLLNEISNPFTTRVRLQEDNMELEWD